MFPKSWIKSILIIANLIIIGGSSISPSKTLIPISGNTSPEGQTTIIGTTNHALQGFVESVADGNPQIRGVYIPHVLALDVIQQPKDQPAFVSIEPETATQFAMASSLGTVGLLAHNYLAGAYFDDAKIGDKISVVHGDGKIEEYQISSIFRFQALNPTDVRTNFVDISTQRQISAEELYKLVYGGEPHLTLQTCIAKGLVSSWGRLFVIATPIISK